jgi:hypothetical protein
LDETIQNFEDLRSGRTGLILGESSKLLEASLDLVLPE